MQKESKYEYSKLATPIKSLGRMFNEKRSLFRSSYQRDRDRIIHSTAFRRLKHKTQVFVNTSRDHYRTRITHSLEVSQIARTLAKFFKLNEDLCETLSLAHDLGHTPFGHAGEEALNECMQKYGSFDHNIQTIRIVTLLEKKYYNFEGLNLSLETLDGLIKHNGPIYNLSKLNSILGKNFFKKKINFHLKDGLRDNLFNINELKEIPILSGIIKKHKKQFKNNDKSLVLRQIVREIIDEMVKDIILNTKKNLKKEKLRNIKDIYNAKSKLVCFSNKMNIFDKSIKKFLMQKMYYSKEVLKRTNEGKKIIMYLFDYINKKPNKFITNKIIKKERGVCDFIAGMTDRYAINLYNSIK